MSRDVTADDVSESRFLVNLVQNDSIRALALLLDLVLLHEEAIKETLLFLVNPKRSTLLSTPSHCG